MSAQLARAKAVFSRLAGLHGTVTITYAQGSNTQSITDAIRLGAARRQDLGNLDQDDDVFLVLAERFESGFSGTNPVNPSGKDTITVSGEKAWTLDVAQLRGAGAYWRLEVSRRRQAGDA